MTTGKFPTTALALTDVFGELPNFPPLTLNGAINASVTSIVVNEAIPATWPQASWITIDTEILRVTSYNAGTKTFTVAARDASAGNAQSTTAATHVSGAYLFVALTAQQWNQAVADLIAVETQLLAVGVKTPIVTPGGFWTWAYDGGMTPVETTDVTGTGAINAISGYSIRRYTTGATSASYAASRATIAGTNNFAVGKVRRWELGATWALIDANTNGAIYLTTENATGAPTATSNHLGIKQAAGVISFSTADGATEQTTNITAFVTANQQHHYVVLFDGTTATLYVDGTLRATHATNVPVSTLSAAVTFKVHIANTAAAGKTLDLYSTQVQLAT